jgi:hypothetical protein
MTGRERADAAWEQARAAADRDAGISIAACAHPEDWGEDVDDAEERCSECDDTGRCWACNGYDPGDDLGSGCSECDGWGNCWCGAAS